MQSREIGKNSIPPYSLLWITFLVCIAFASVSSGQAAFPTSRSDNQRTGANVTELLLAPSNVNKNRFGRLFRYSIDYQALAQPLYVPNVTIPGLGTHNVVYVATMADSVYAFDADSNQGANAAPLWRVNFTDPANGITTASVATSTLPCASTETAGPGITQEGIVSTPVIDAATGTLYVVAKTLENGTVRHRLHALDITTGQEKFGGPAPIAATSISNAGHKMVFNSLHQKNRPGLLLLNGVIYLGFGSNYCNDSNSGWVLSYDAASLSQLAVFNTSPDHGLTSIWQTGNGLGADEAGNIFVETAESGAPFDVPSGGQTFCNSVVKLAPNLTVADYFTPGNVAFLNSHDFDLSSTGALVLPDQNSPFPHELVAGGKQGIVYVLNRDNMGMFAPNDSQVLQEFPLVPGATSDILMSSPAYWNNTVYFAPNGSPLLAFPLSGGLLGIPLKTSAKYPGAHSPSISANGNSNGILWVIGGGQLLAFDATSLHLLYGTNQALGGRDTLPPLAHFATQTVANGRVYVATRTTLEVYGLIPHLAVAGGANQSATVFTTLPTPLKVQARDPYTGVADSGVSVTFSDGGKGGTFNPPSAVTDINGFASATYTLPKKSGPYTLTVSAPNFVSATATETALPGAPVKIISFGGAKQSGTAGTVLPKPIAAQARDALNNGVPGVTVNFSATGNGSLNPISVVTDASGVARTAYQLPTTVGTFNVTASSAGLTSVKFPETSLAGPPTSVNVAAGNNQTAAAGTQLPVALMVLVTDQYGNPVPSASVTFDDGGAGGSFLNPNPAVTDSTGKASQIYTLPPSPGTITISATAIGVASPALFTETAQ
ncbi:MAG TPA: Ig-like domain-containing protein [Terriglobales bacterium]|nr:Ig-like domain-containing protein [Terriglobales bacterium]